MTSLLGPVTDADERRWQRRRYDILGELITFGEQQKLTPLSWNVSVHALIGTATGTDPERRATFEEWADAFGVLDWWEQHYDTGRIHLHASTDDLWGRGVGVKVLADLWEDHPAE